MDWSELTLIGFVHWMFFEWFLHEGRITTCLCSFEGSIWSLLAVEVDAQCPPPHYQRPGPEPAPVLSSSFAGPHNYILLYIVVQPQSFSDSFCIAEQQALTTTSLQPCLLFSFPDNGAAKRAPQHPALARSCICWAPWRHDRCFHAARVLPNHSS